MLVELIGTRHIVQVGKSKRSPSTTTVKLQPSRKLCDFRPPLAHHPHHCTQTTHGIYSHRRDGPRSCLSTLFILAEGKLKLMWRLRSMHPSPVFKFERRPVISDQAKTPLVVVRAGSSTLGMTPIFSKEAWMHRPRTSPYLGQSQERDVEASKEGKGDVETSPKNRARKAGTSI
ncbi:hypothetical protein VNO77_03571 [Canavalia gladiata]|uniref:Uncharacterized protein n=1 Tax=Canavalia gladiata TaxID=3824 RepID=A0AAN9RCD1_CANGL